MSWRDRFNERFGPGGFTGCSFGDWMKTLWRARFAVDFRYWPRAALITFNSLPNSLGRLWETLRYSPQIEQTEVPAPLFVLGIWRSGTTHLHNLLARDARFAFGNTYEVLCPHTFLFTESWHAPMLQPFMPETRPMDNVRSSLWEPQEDESALAACGISFVLEMAFPRMRDHFHRYLTLRDLTPAELDAWKASFMTFLRKLTLKHRRPLVLKSPGHTARIRILLEMFPNAKFVHIHRNPFDVYQSTEHTWRKIQPIWALQSGGPEPEHLIRDYRDLYEAFFEERALIPEGNYCEVAYEQLVADQLGEMRRIYETLNLPEFEQFEPDLKEYLASIAGYSRNPFPELSTEMRDRLAAAWSRCFEEWGYAK
jgi:hypothetical protein